MSMSPWRSVTVSGKDPSNKGAAARLKVLKRAEAEERAADVRHYTQRAHRLSRTFLSARQAQEERRAGGHFLCTCPVPGEPSYATIQPGN